MKFNTLTSESYCFLLVPNYYYYTLCSVRLVFDLLMFFKRMWSEAYLGYVYGSRDSSTLAVY